MLLWLSIITVWPVLICLISVDTDIRYQHSTGGKSNMADMGHLPAKKRETQVRIVMTKQFFKHLYNITLHSRFNRGGFMGKNKNGSMVILWIHVTTCAFKFHSYIVTKRSRASWVDTNIDGMPLHVLNIPDCSRFMRKHNLWPLHCL